MIYLEVSTGAPWGEIDFDVTREMLVMSSKCAKKCVECMLPVLNYPIKAKTGVRLEINFWKRFAEFLDWDFY